LGQAVDKLLHPRWIRMRLAVPLVVAGRVTQPEIRAEINDAIRERREMIDTAHGAAVRQPEKEQIALLDRLGSDELELRALPQVRMREMHELAIQPLTGDLLHLEIRMGQRQTQQFAAGIAGGAD